MTILDTHIWVWWVNQDSRLPPLHRNWISAHEAEGLGVSVISCWEVAKLAQLGRLHFTMPVLDWVERALRYPGVQLIPLSPKIAVESTRLPGEFHRDPSDQIIVATARVLDFPLSTLDEKILNYPHVKLVR